MTLSDTKQCRTCKELKSLSEFYKHKMMLDGTLNICKVCTKQRVKAHREANLERIQEYDRNRPNKDVRSEYNKEKYKRKRKEGDLDFLEKDRERIRQNRLRNPEKQKARNAVSNGLRDGKITRPDCCSKCGKQCKPHGHHWSYLEQHWLDVVWLCTRCHADEHLKYPKLDC